MVQAILFDIDGTLLDSVDFHARAWQEILARHGIEVTFDEVRAQIGKGGDQLLPVFVPKPMLERVVSSFEVFQTEPPSRPGMDPANRKDAHH
jgi:beta-phosphoglucomutase-like phosphatase (HAD superfamily)